MNNQNITVQQLLKNRILWRIYLLWFLRRIVPLIILQVAVFVLALQLFAKNVFVSKIFQNVSVVAGAGYLNVLKYAFAAFLNTRPLTQAVILLILGVVALLLRDFIRALTTYKSMWMRR
jgi:hypothetical protein